MLRNGFTVVLAATLLPLLVASRAQAWGAAHVGYTHVGPAGVYHVGRTAGVGPYGGFYGGRWGYGGYGGFYRGGYGYRGWNGGYFGGYPYYPAYYGGYYGVPYTTWGYPYYY
jgi:hypothetical protein